MSASLDRIRIVELTGVNPDGRCLDGDDAGAGEPEPDGDPLPRLRHRLVRVCRHACERGDFLLKKGLFV